MACSYERGTPVQVRTLTGHSGNVLSVASSPDGKRVVSGSSDKTVKIWVIATGAEVNSFSSVLHGF